MKALSLFSSAGIGELYLEEIGIDVVVSNELIEKRAKTYEFFYPKSQIFKGDIRDKNIKDKIIDKSKELDVKMLIATPPCQGMSLAGKNKSQDDMNNDPRNYLIFDVLEVIDSLDLDYILIENVPRFLKLYYPFNNKWMNIVEILNEKYKEQYKIEADIINSADLGVPQTRMRSIIKIYKKDLKWEKPTYVEKHITVREAIEDLPSLESGEYSNIKNHWARVHPENQIIWMKNTPTGKTAIENEVYYPCKEDGTRIKGYNTCYKRMEWDKPALTITMRNEIISSQNNVHPGRKKADGTWSDARVLSIRELLILSSINGDLDIPTFISDTEFRHLVGEGVPPLMMKKIIEGVCVNKGSAKFDKNKRLKGLSLFSGGGVGETYFKECGIDIVVANELVENRARFYQDMHKDSNMINGDITDDKVFNKVIEIAKEKNVKFLVATPPCQGMSTLGKKDYDTDERNYLIYNVIRAIDSLDLDYVLIENVPKFLELYFPYNGKMIKIVDVLKIHYGEKYNIEARVLNAMNYNVPQSRPRAIIKMYKKDKKWVWPRESKKIITLEKAIGGLPSIESEEDSGIRWHYAKKHNEMHIEVMRNTPEGKSAMQNEVYYPKKPDGSKIKGFHNTYKRMKWNEPAPARAMNNGSISGHNNVHPGRKREDGTWSDARVLTILELLIVSSLPTDWNIPEWASENLVRQIIGESVPPMLSRAIVSQIDNV